MTPRVVPCRHLRRHALFTFLLWLAMFCPRGRGLSTTGRTISSRLPRRRQCVGRLRSHNSQPPPCCCCSCRDDEEEEEEDEQESERPPIHTTSRSGCIPRRRFLAWGSVAGGSAVSWFDASPARAAAVTDTMASSSPEIINHAAVIPFSSSRRYETITLRPNGLRVVLVQDDDDVSRQASVALSVGGAGQWADPDDVPGLAHLCEHAVLSFASSSSRRGRLLRRRRRQLPLDDDRGGGPSPAQDLEEWLADHEGSSNAFTAHDNVCFHFTCPDAYLEEGLERFARLFDQSVFDTVSRDADALRREIGRVDSELDQYDPSWQATCLSKAFVVPEHPYARFSAGDAETLRDVVVPRVTDADDGIDVGERLRRFFRTAYQPTEAVLVVTAPRDLTTLRRWVLPFASTLSRERLPFNNDNNGVRPRRFYPGGFLRGTRLKQMVILRNNDNNNNKDENDVEPLQMEWILNLDYTDALRDGQATVTGTQMAFCLAQILGRRGPGSLYAFLLRRGWVSRKTGNAGVPRVTLPVDVSGFQVIKLEILLTVEGFVERSAVVAAVYDSLEALRRGSGYGVVRESVTQWASIAKLHGYLLTPRPPDAIELSQDVHTYGLNGPNGVGSGTWYRFPEPDDRSGINALQRALSATLQLMSDPGNAVVIAVANRKTMALANLPPVETSRRWRTEPLTGGRFLYDDMLGLSSRLEELVLTRVVDREELLRPVLNPLVPIILKTPRPLSLSGTSDPRSTSDVLPLIARDSADPSREFRLRSSSSFTTTRLVERNRWTLLEPAEDGQYGLQLPRYPPEPNYRSVFVVELLSPRPARASLREAARGELFKISFEYDVADLAELGAPGGLAYDVSFNKYGTRLAFVGINQNLPSYARRFCRRLVEHPNTLLSGPEFFSSRVTDAAVISARRVRGLSQLRRGTIVSAIRGATAYEAAAEGNAFLRSCATAVCFAEGDWSTTREVLNLKDDLEAIFAPLTSTSSSGRLASPSAVPNLDDLVYKPVWKPRFGSSCTLAGVMLLSDACGRVPR